MRILTTHIGSLPRARPASPSYARLVGRARVIAGVDCGFATFADTPTIDPKIAWAKLGAMVQGARLASRALWK
jgi:5-methyltetrahydropteroyltriglutamate--homocysteine methyltransferase